MPPLKPKLPREMFHSQLAVILSVELDIEYKIFRQLGRAPPWSNCWPIGL